MTVNIGKSIYDGLSIVQFNELLKIASDSVLRLGFMLSREKVWLLC